MRTRLRSWWRKIKQHPTVAILVIAGSALATALILVLILGYLLNWHWTGLVSETSEPKQHTKTLWDWLQLLIIPIILAVGGFWLNQIQKSREEKTTKQRAEDEQK